MSLLADLRERGTERDFQEMVSLIPYARFLDIRVEQDADGGYRTRLPFAEGLVGNPNLPALHGGVIGGFLETTAILQLVWEGSGDSLAKPIGITIDYLRSGKSRDTRACGVITKLGRRIASVRVEAWQDDRSRPIAIANGHFLTG